MPPRRIGSRSWTLPLSLAAVCALVLSGCGLLDSDDAAPVFADFVAAVEAGDAEGAARMTTDPEAARQAIAASVLGVAGAEGDPAEAVSAQWANDDAHAERAGTGEDGPLEIEYTWRRGEHEATGTGEATMTRSGEDWLVEWTPRILDTRLADGGRIAYRPVLGSDIDVVDRTGEPLWVWEEVTEVTLAQQAEASADPLAAALSGPVPGLDGQSVRDGLAGWAEDPESAQVPYTVVALRDGDLEPVREQLEGIEGVSLERVPQLIRADRGLRTPVLDGLEQAALDDAAATGGWEIVVENPGPGGTLPERTRLAGDDPAPGETVVSALQLDLQRAAQDAVDSSGYAASIVALQPSTGQVLAVAQNSAADAQGAVSLGGQFPPGSTFKVATTAALLEHGIAGPDTIVACPAVASISGRTMPNHEDIGFGQVPLRRAFAESCNTTMGLLSDQLPDDHDIAAASHQLGVGVDYDIPGLEVDTGDVPHMERGPQRVEGSIGQGTVLSSPFGMAAMMASVGADGRQILPEMIVGRPATSSIETEPLRPETVGALRDMLTAAVVSGTASDAAGVPGLGGKTGTAETWNGPAHGWFAGLRDDLAFAVLLEHADSSKLAVQLAARFLSAAPAPVPAIEAGPAPEG